MLKFRKLIILVLIFALSSCSILSTETAKTDQSFLDSGTIVLSQKVPSKTQQLAKEENEQTAMAPVVGYFPDGNKFFPAINENWISIDKKTGTISLFEGEKEVEKIAGVGELNIEAGNYNLLHKETNPLWYAPDTYFTKRGIEIPSSIDSGRYRRGAYGDLALFLPNSEAIHTSPVWTDEVGGLRLDEEKMRKVYDSLSIGAQIVVR